MAGGARSLRQHAPLFALTLRLWILKPAQSTLPGVDAEGRHRWGLGRAKPDQNRANNFGLALMAIGAAVVCAWIPDRLLWVLIVGVALFAAGAVIALVTMGQAKPSTGGAAPSAFGPALKKAKPEDVARAEQAMRGIDNGD
jgi:hypothetical protein